MEDQAFSVFAIVATVIGIIILVAGAQVIRSLTWWMFGINELIQRQDKIIELLSNNQNVPNSNQTQQRALTQRNRQSAPKQPSPYDLT